MADRVCLGIEIVPEYVDIAVARWERFTGSLAQLSSSADRLITG